MTIRPGDAWGTRVARPADLVAASFDAQFVELALGPDRPPVRLVAGDLARTLGVAPGDGRATGQDGTLLELPVDVVEVTTDVGDFVACAHVIVAPPARRGGWWAGPLVAVMNAQFVGDWDVAPRGHPNDGRVEVFEVTGSLSIRDRLAVRRRLPLGTHVPHPAIRTRSVREAAFEFERPMTARVDGIAVGTVRSLAVRVRPDAVHAYV
ncbi:MAG: hypothetical protein ABWZ99_18575 [Ilumatobacteraceae bacterium]